MFKKILLATAVLGLPAAAQAEWVRAASKHFVVFSNDRPDTVKAFTVRLERFDAVVRVALKLGNPEIGPDARVRVFVLPTLEAVQKFSGGMGNVAGFYQNSYPSDIFAVVPRRSFGDGDEQTLTAQQILFHEYTHHIMYSSFEGTAVPTWFSEGFAELFATARFDAKGSVTFGNVPMYRAYGVGMSNVVPASDLLKSGPDYHDGMQTQVYYGRAWLLTDYLMFDHERSKLLAAYLTDINNGKSSLEAAKVFGNLTTLDGKMNGYGQRKSWPLETIAADRIPIDEITVETLGPGANAIMPVQIRSQIGVDDKQAPTVAADAQRIAASYPDDPAVQNELAEAQYDAKNYSASEQAADRVLAVDPKSVHGLIYKGMAQIARLKKTESKDNAAWTTARRYYLAANKADPLYSYPPQLYYESFGEQGIKPTPAALSGLLYAYKLRPDLASLRFETARALIEQGNKEAAIVVIEPLAYSPHGGPETDFARKILDALKAGGAGPALKIITDAEEEAKKKAKQPLSKSGPS